MRQELNVVKVGLALVMVGLLFGVGMGMGFGLKEDAFKGYIAEGIAAHPEVHDEKSQSKIWRYAQRAHFHATGIAAFSFGLIILVMYSDLKAKMKRIAAGFLGLSSFYPLSWFTMFLLAPSIGRGPAHSHILTETFVMIGVGGVMVGTFLLCANLFLGMFREEAGG